MNQIVAFTDDELFIKVLYVFISHLQFASHKYRIHGMTGTGIKQIADAVISIGQRQIILHIDQDQVSLIAFLDLTEEDVALMYDLAARENSRIPRDLEDTMMYSEAGEMARYALRMTKKGVVNDDDWKDFIRYIKTKEK